VAKDLVVLGMLGTTLDAGAGPERWETWRPTVALCSHEDLLVRRFDLLLQARYAKLATEVAEDIRSVSPETEVRQHHLEFQDPWDFEQVYSALHDFASRYPFDHQKEDYLVHMTTGSHVAQICLFLLTESRRVPARLIQSSPPKRRARGGPGTYAIIDLDLSKYDLIARRFRKDHSEALSFLKSGIETRNKHFNRMIERIESVAISSRAPILLTGPTGAGKSQLARRIYELKKGRQQVEGGFVELNCATLKGEAAMSALFGHVKGAFTGALQDRPGLLRAADRGMLFLDEIGDLGLDEQAMLLRALEEKVFLPLGADREAKSDFQLLAGTHRDLAALVAQGRFREDLLTRINLWSFQLPGLAERPEDVEVNLEYELDLYERRSGDRVTFNREARERFLRFATSRAATWRGNFRDFNASVTRMATLAPGGRISVETVEEEIARLQGSWRAPSEVTGDAVLERLISPERLSGMDRVDRVLMREVLEVCRRSRSISEAGRILYAATRARKTTVNDADRLRKYLARYGLRWHDLGP
jgi:transcriptional regulatory protein RtcR